MHPADVLRRVGAGFLPRVVADALVIPHVVPAIGFIDVGLWDVRLNPAAAAVLIPDAINPDARYIIIN